MAWTILLAVLLAAALLAWPRISQATGWRATVTPLASIIGSGFLILGPVMLENFGSWAPLAMILLCALGFAFGSAIRFNIARLGDSGAVEASRPLAWGEQLSAWALAFAYFISVAYYLNLFGAFAGRIAGIRGGDAPRLITSAVYLAILAAGYLRGFGMMERMEKISVSIKLAIIAGLLAGVSLYAAGLAETHEIVGSPAPTRGVAAFQLLLGLIVTVQGFETSRYLGKHYNAAVRIRSMRNAQWLSTVIYMVYAVLLALSFRSGQFTLDETAVIDMMHVVSVLLPPLLILAALSAQFSAAVADTGASGGLLQELSGRRISARNGYLLLTAIGLLLTWAFDVFQIINYASQAFAFYYGVQSLLAAARARDLPPGWPRTARIALFVLLGVLGLSSVLISTPVEG